MEERERQLDAVVWLYSFPHSLSLSLFHLVAHLEAPSSSEYPFVLPSQHQLVAVVSVVCLS